MQEYTISDIIQMFLKRWVLFVIAIVVCGVVGFGYTKFFIPDTYSSSGMIYVNNRDYRFNQNLNTGANLNDLYAAERLIENFKIILKTDKFLNYVIEDLDIDITPKQLKSMLSVSSSDDTEIIKLTITCGDPNMAQRIATAVLTNSKTQLYDILDAGYIKIIEDASFSLAPVGPNTKLNTLISMFLGAILVAAFVLFKELTNTTITAETDIENSFDVPLVGLIPDLNEAIFEDNNYLTSYK